MAIKVLSIAIKSEVGISNDNGTVLTLALPVFQFSSSFYIKKLKYKHRSSKIP